MAARPVFPDLLHPTAISRLSIIALIFALLITLFAFLYVATIWDASSPCKRQLIWGIYTALLALPFVAFGICEKYEEPELAFQLLLDGATIVGLMIEVCFLLSREVYPLNRYSGFSSGA